MVDVIPFLAGFCTLIGGPIILWRFKPFLSAGLRVHSYLYLALYGPEMIGCFGLEEESQKTKAVCGLERTNYGGLRNV